MKQIIQSTKLFRFFMAKRQGVPFRTKEWYNYRAMLSKEELPKYAFIEIFDTNGNYIACPEIGGVVIFNHKGQRFKYRVVGFKNESRNRDWLYDTDYINPVIEYLCKID